VIAEDRSIADVVTIDPSEDDPSFRWKTLKNSLWNDADDEAKKMLDRLTAIKEDSKPKFWAGFWSDELSKSIGKIMNPF
jgi:hypothetical protein